jgi:6-phosphofructokinase 1
MNRGENALIAVAGPVTAVTNSIIAGIIDEASRGGQMADIFGAQRGVPGIIDGRLLDMGAQKRRTIEGLRRTPGSVLSGRHRVIGDAEAAQLVDVLKLNAIGTLFLIGGLPALGLLRLIIEKAGAAQHALVALGIPAAAENEVDGGDHTPGYPSAARFTAIAARDSAHAARAGEEPILVQEYLGAQSGWLPAAAALARDAVSRAPHAILFPERAVEAEAVVDVARRAYQKHGYAMVVTAEGAQDTAGQSLAGAELAQLLTARLELPVRLDRPGSLARVTQSAVARVDVDESYNIGTLAARLADDECSGYLVTVGREGAGERGYKPLEGTARLDQVEDTPRVLPAAFIADDGLDVSPSFLDWAKPLVGGALPDYVALEE